MSLRVQISVLSSLVILATAQLPTHADIYRWDNGQLIPGEEGIAPGPREQMAVPEPSGAALLIFG